MDIAQLQRMGLQASNPLIKKTITIKYFPLIDQSPDADPSGPRSEEEQEGTADFWIRKFTASDRIATAHLANSDSPEEATLLAIQRSIFTEDGKPVFPDVESVRGLDLEMFAPLLHAIHQINESGSKKSRPRTNGGTPSPLPSGEGLLGSGKRRSRKKKSDAGSSSPTSMAP